jgi:elongation factor P hydroxylase
MECADLIRVFDTCFAGPAEHPEDRARLVRGGDEPLFLPAGRHRPVAEIVFARGLPQSCLHEASHWLRASRARRRLVDYGYWYEPDGRDARAQLLFETHEAQVQALERTLSQSAGVEFSISCDNLSSPTPSSAFIAAIETAERRLNAQEVSPRIHSFMSALQLQARRGRPKSLISAVDGEPWFPVM